MTEQEKVAEMRGWLDRKIKESRSTLNDSSLMNRRRTTLGQEMAWQSALGTARTKFNQLFPETEADDEKD